MINFTLLFGSIAQSAEHSAVNRRVEGSSPSGSVGEQKSTRFLSEMVLAPSLNLYYLESCFNDSDFGALAQLGEHYPCKVGVMDSNSICSIIIFLEVYSSG